MCALTHAVNSYSCNYHNQENPFMNGVNVDALKKKMLVFRRVKCSDMRYYIKQLLFKCAEGKATRSPRGEGRGCGSPQNMSTTEGLRKDRKRKLDAVLVEDDTRPTVSCFL